jgi:hypothetical protein
LVNVVAAGIANPDTRDDGEVIDGDIEKVLKTGSKEETEEEARALSRKASLQKEHNACVNSLKESTISFYHYSEGCRLKLTYCLRPYNRYTAIYYPAIAVSILVLRHINLVPFKHYRKRKSNMTHI